MKKYLLALSLGLTLAMPTVKAQGLAQAAKVARAANNLIGAAPDIIILLDELQKMPQLAKNLKDKTRSKADKVADAQQALQLMTQLQPILQRLLTGASDIAVAVNQQANADKIKIVAGYINDGFGALKDITEILDVIQLMQQQPAEQA